MTTLNKDGRVTTSSEKQIYLFGMLLDKINGRTIKCSANTKQRVDKLYDDFQKGKLSSETIRRKATTLSKVLYTEDYREFHHFFDGKINTVENDLHMPKDKHIKQYYLILPKEAKDHILQIFSQGIFSRNHGGLYETNPLPKCINVCVVELYIKKSDLIKVERNLFEQSLSDSNLQDGLYYKDNIIPIKNIVKIQYI